MSPEEHKAIIRRVIAELLNRGNVGVIDEAFDLSFVDLSSPDQPPGLEGVKGFVSIIRASIPDLYVEINDLIAEDDKVVVRTTWYGTLASNPDVPSSGTRQMLRTMIQIFRLADGKIVQEWNEGEGLL